MVAPRRTREDFSDGDSLPGASRLSGLSLLKGDLELVQQICAFAVDAASRQQLPAVLLEACEMGAVVRYGRCFAEGRGTRLSSREVARAAGEDAGRVELHRQIISLRNRHVAHQAGVWAGGTIGLVLTDDDGPTSCLEVGNFWAARNPDVEIFEPLRVHAEWMVSAVVDVALEKAQDRLYAAIEALTSEELEALPPMKLVNMGGLQWGADARSDDGPWSSSRDASP